MSNKQQTLEQIESTGVVAVIRLDDASNIIEVCEALCAGGVVACEITLTTPGAIDAIARVANELGDDCVVGVGSVLEPSQAEAAIDAGARFVVSPVLNIDVIDATRRFDRVCICGGLTPTEIATAWNAGADIVKIFPANHFGPRYIKDIHAPMPHLKVTPTGGVDLNTAADWIKAGAATLGVGSSLVQKKLVQANDWPALTALAKQYIDIVTQARAEV